MEVAEEWERERRRNRLVLMGIPEVGDDGGGNEIVQEVMKGLLYEEKVQYQVLGRIGKKGLRARPIRVIYGGGEGSEKNNIEQGKGIEEN